MTAQGADEIGEGRDDRGRRLAPPSTASAGPGRHCTRSCTGPCTSHCTPECATHIRLVGISGGAGTSTVAAVLALHASRMVPTVLVTGDPDHSAALLGLAMSSRGEVVAADGRSLTIAERPNGAEECVIVDEGRLQAVSQRQCEPGERRVGVLRGPCYLALRQLLAGGSALDGVILVAEGGRALNARDVVDVAGIDVLATVPVDPAIARSIDAGVLAARYRALRQLRPLQRWLELQLEPFRACTTPPMAAAPPDPGMHGTDLLLPPPAKEARCTKSFEVEITQRREDRSLLACTTG